MLVSGIPMHRIKETDPIQDTRTKIEPLAEARGPILDTATGLGYTAIEASKGARAVTTIELDPAALEIARLNPWSRRLFENERITQVIGDTFEEVRKLPSGTFGGIIHDPPTIQLAGELYSVELYRELRRVMRRGGTLFHYLGDPNSGQGVKVTQGAVKRLAEAGFSRLERHPEAFGVTVVAR